MERGSGHNDKLDLFKCISIYAVVLAHIPLPGQFGWALCALAKFSVVLFFLTAGYFSYEKFPRVLARRAGLALCEIHLQTGRSHQIRVQFSHGGWPLWGDARYGGGRPGEQIALWGCALDLVHPTKKEAMHFSCPPPEVPPFSRFPEARRAGTEDAPGSFQ